MLELWNHIVADFSNIGSPETMAAFLQVLMIDIVLAGDNAIVVGALAAGLPPDSIQVNMIVDDSMNAFATQGNNVYFHTGLLLRAKNSNEVIGVMAHEFGHIAGGHVVMVGSDMAGATAISLLSTLLGMVSLPFALGVLREWHP